MKKGNKKKTFIYAGLLLLITVILFAALLAFFDAQLHSDGKTFVSDIGAHLKSAKKGTGYSLLIQAMGALYKASGTSFSIAVLEAVMVIATWLLSAKLIESMHEKLNYFFSALIALPATFLSGIYIPEIYENFYRQQIVTQPYHNITYTGMRVCAVLVMLMFYKVFESYLQKIKWHEWVLLAAALALTTAVKPSFFYGFALALLLFLIVDFFRTKCQWKPFWKIVIMGCVVFPSLAIMALQASTLFGKPVSEGGSGIALIWGANFVKHGIQKTALKLFCGLAFPTVVALGNIKRFKKTEWFVYVMYAVELAIGMIFVETGARANHGNFFWGVYGGAFFLFVIAFGRYVDDLIHFRERNKLYLIIGGILMLAHVISSAAFFIVVMSGENCFM